METRRIRRLERRHSRRIALATAALGAIGVAVGLALPRNTTASALVLVVAGGTLAAIALRADSSAPSHGLRHVVRLPIRSAVAASVASLWSRVVGTTRGLWRSTPSAVPDAEDDDEARAWWAPRLDLHSDAVSLAAGPSEPDRIEPAPAGFRRELARIGRGLTRRLGTRRVPDDGATSDALEGSATPM